MKGITFIILTFSLIFCSCNKNEPDLEIILPISETYIPSSIEVDTKNIDDAQKRDIIYLVNTDLHIVNGPDELPKDPIGFGDAFNTINFKHNTLLIKFMLHDYSIDTYSNRYYRNTKENTYNWVVNVGTASSSGNDSDNIQLTRFAILVNKLPADATVKSWFGLTYLGWFPSE